MKQRLKKVNYDYEISLAGNPNVGKSTVFNSLTGMNQHTGNWSGKTVSNAIGFYMYDKMLLPIKYLDKILSFYLNLTNKEEDSTVKKQYIQMIEKEGFDNKNTSQYEETIDKRYRNLIFEASCDKCRQSVISKLATEKNGLKSLLNDFETSKKEERSSSAIKVGDKIMHKIFGKGIVVKVEFGKITVALSAEYGIKTLMADHPSITRI